jgi:hypothetical protein
VCIRPAPTLRMLASLICDSQDGAGSSLERDLSVASISVSSTDADKSVDPISDYADGPSSLERDLSAS